METPPPDMLQIRRETMPESWTAEKKEREMHVPDWLVTMVYKCLEKIPESRFANGVELQEYVVINSSRAAKKSEANAEQSGYYIEENERLVKERELMKNNLLEYRHQIQLRDKELQELKTIIANNDSNNSGENIAPLYAEESTERGVSKTAFVTLLILTIGLAAFAAYSFFKNTGTQTQQYADSTQNKIDSIVQADTASSNQVTEEKKDQVKDTTRAIAQKPVVEQDVQQENTGDTSKEQTAETPEQTEQRPAARSSGKYTVISKAYFHDKAHPSTRRKGFINVWNKAVLTPLGETDDFIYIEYTNTLGQTSKGWLRKVDLKVID
jgi:serine/threonine-protein kinase